MKPLAANEARQTSTNQLLRDLEVLSDAIMVVNTAGAGWVGGGVGWGGVLFVHRRSGKGRWLRG